MLLLLLLLSALLLRSGSHAALNYALDLFGCNSIRLRVAAPTFTGALGDPLYSGLLPTAPSCPSQPNVAVHLDGNITSLVSGDLLLTFDVVSGSFNATRVHDGYTFLQLESLRWAAPANRSSAGSNSVTAQFAGVNVSGGERMYGGGPMGNRAGVVFTLPWSYTIEETEYYPMNEGRDSLVPLFFSTFGYGLLWNTPSYGSISIDEGGSTFHSSALSFVDLWITTTCATCAAAPFPALFQQSVDAMGHAPPLPSFATGFIQCKDRYRNQSQLMAVAEGYVSRGLPISMLVVDWFHWQELGDMRLNPNCWPDPAGMIENLRNLGIEIMITFWPFVSNQSVNWPDYAEANTWLAVNASAGKITQFYDFIPSSVIDPTNASAAAATFQKWWEGYGQFGSRAIWLDETEPDRGSYSYGDWDFAAGSDYEVGAGWTSAWLQLFEDGFDSMGVPPSERFILSRAIRAGTHRHGFAMWSGDTDSDWTTLAQQVADVQQAGFALQAYWTSDTGGYNGGDPTNPDFQQLIVRWMQFSTFSPLMRLHGHRQGPADPVDECGYTAGPNEVWTLAPDAEHYDALAACLNLRENLRPYVANISATYSYTGMPMVRPLFIAFPSDPACVGMEDAFMFGPTYLLQPIVTANVTQVTAYLPMLIPQQQQQQQWVYFFDNTVTSNGGENVTITVSLATFPLFFIQDVAAEIYTVEKEKQEISKYS